VTRLLLALAALLAALSATADRIYWNDALASELIGAEIVNSRGEHLGEVRDLSIDLKAGQARSALVESGGFLGAFEEVRAYPVSWFAPGALGGRVVLDIPAAQIASVPQAPAPDMPRASELLGREVRDRAGVVAGELRDIVVNLGDGRLRHALVMLERPERQVTIVPPLLSLRGDVLVVEMNLAELQALVSP
jgi:sporulation protein YlmC with PRC-barrel domain